MNTGADNFRAYRSLFNIASGSSSMPLPEEVTSEFPISDGTGRQRATKEKSLVWLNWIRLLKIYASLLVTGGRW